MVLCFAMVEGTANDWLTLGLIDGYGVEHWVGVAGFALFVVAMTGGRLYGPVLLDRFGRPAVLWGSAALAALGALLTVLGEVLPLVALGIVLWGLGAALGFPVGMSAAADGGGRAAARVSVVSTIGYGAFLAFGAGCALTLTARHPQDVALLPVGVPGQDEDQVGEPVEVGDGELVHRLPVLLEGRPGRALGPPHDGPGHVEVGRPRRTAGEDEGAQDLQVLVVLVAPRLEAVDVVLLDPQRRELGVRDHRGAEVGADVEEVVLDVGEHPHHVVLEPAAGDGQADRRVGLVDVGVGVQTQVVLRRHAHVPEPGLAGVAGAGVDARQVDHARERSHRSRTGG